MAKKERLPQSLATAGEVQINVMAYNSHKRTRANMVGITDNEVYVVDTSYATE